MRFILAEDGFEFLGCPTSRSLLWPRSVKILSCYKLVALDDPLIAFTLLRVCTYAGKVNHYLRVLPPSVVRCWSANLTTFLRSCLGQLVGSAVDDVQWAQSSLPIRIGGLGMSDLSLVSLAAFTSSVLRAWQFWSGFGLAIGILGTLLPYPNLNSPPMMSQLYTVLLLSMEPPPWQSGNLRR